MSNQAGSTNSTRELTYDEKKASEAAFLGLPLNPSWSHRAQETYNGILSAMSKQGKTTVG